MLRFSTSVAFRVFRSTRKTYKKLRKTWIFTQNQFLRKTILDIGVTLKRITINHKYMKFSQNVYTGILFYLDFPPSLLNQYIFFTQYNVRLDIWFFHLWLYPKYTIIIYISEGWNNKFVTLVRINLPNIWHFIDAL